MVGAIPDVSVRSHAEIGPERCRESLPDKAVHSVRAGDQIAIHFQGLKIVDFSSKPDFDAKLFTTVLENLQQAQTRDPGKAVAANGDFFAAMNDVDIVPGCKVPGNFSV